MSSSSFYSSLARKFERVDGAALSFECLSGVCVLHCATKFYDLHRGNVSKFVRGSTGGEEAGRSLSGNESNLSLLDRYWALKRGAGYEGDCKAREEGV